MESFAFWYEKRNPSDEHTEPLYAVMNFNLWCECGWDDKHKASSHSSKESYPYLDIGFKLTNLHAAKNLYYFIPYRIEQNDLLSHIQDLGCKFKDTALVDAVFNENYRTTIAASEKTIDVASQSNVADCFKIYQLDIENDITLQHFGSGTILSFAATKITQKASPSHEDAEATSSENHPVYYLRFRIKGYPLDFIIHKYSARNAALQSLFNETYMIDFRYNNIRSLDNSLIEKFSEPGNEVVKVTALHFLLMTKAYVDVSSKEFSTTRKIEPKVWENYVDQQDTTDLVAYHFAHKPKKDKSASAESDGKSPIPTISSSELFAKFCIERSVLWKYVFFTIALGAIGSIIGSTVFPHLEKIYTLIKNLLN